jgi:hypothetical protein
MPARAQRLGDREERVEIAERAECRERDASHAAKVMARHRRDQLPSRAC